MHIIFNSYVIVSEYCCFFSKKSRKLSLALRDFTYFCVIKMRNIRRNGSAAPHNSWSPTVNAER